MRHRSKTSCREFMSKVRNENTPFGQCFLLSLHAAALLVTTSSPLQHCCYIYGRGNRFKPGCLAEEYIRGKLQCNLQEGDEEYCDRNEWGIWGSSNASMWVRWEAFLKLLSDVHSCQSQWGIRSLGADKVNAGSSCSLFVCLFSTFFFYYIDAHWVFVGLLSWVSPFVIHHC